MQVPDASRGLWSAGLLGRARPDITMFVQRESTITCPACGHRKLEKMPEDACVVFYECDGCGATLRPCGTDCCVFCSYGDVPCPPVQADQKCG